MPDRRIHCLRGATVASVIAACRLPGIALLVLWATPGRADPPSPPPCVHEALVAGLDAARAQAAAGHLRAASDALAALVGSCDFAVLAWRDAESIADYRAVLAERAAVHAALGEHEACLRILGPIAVDLSDSDDANPSKRRALGLIDQCQAGRDARFGGFSRDACTLVADDAVAAVALPAAAVPKGSDAACIAFEGLAGDDAFMRLTETGWGNRAETQRHSRRLCGHAVLVTRAGKKVTRRTLASPTDGRAFDVGFCCNVGRGTLSVDAATRRLRIRAQGASVCGGGSATVSLDEVYQWSARALELVDQGTFVLR